MSAYNGPRETEMPRGQESWLYGTVWLIYAATAFWWNTTRTDINKNSLQVYLRDYFIVRASAQRLLEKHMLGLDEFWKTEYKDSNNTITFVAIGRLGNRLYEYASMVGIAQRNGLAPHLPIGIGLGECFHDIRAPVQHDINPGKEYHPADLHFSLEAFQIGNQSTLLRSQMQSWKYFGHVESRLRREFVFHDVYQKYAASTIASIPTNGSIATYVIVQVRRTDFVKDYSNLINPVTEDYLKRCMHLFESTFVNVRFLVVSDDIEWCKSRLPKLTQEYQYFSENRSACEDLALIALSNHTIITAGSSFGWWGAFLANGHVTYFPGWLKYGGWYNLKIKEEDVYLPRWTEIPR